jgi:SAM-dependent MidA family methyltransferase
MTLRDRIVATISAEGPIPFERFMGLSLYEPDGFFGGGVLRSEKSGDFLTSPEVSSVFGATLAGYVRAERERIGEPFELVEVAAGSGSLIGPLLDAFPVAAKVVEVSPAARDAVRAAVAGVEVVDELPETVRGVILANELLDNLPMAIAQKIQGGWRERWVGMSDGGLELVDAPARPDVLEWLERFAGPVAEGGWVEVQLTASEWVRDALARIEAGSLVIIDYGDTSENLLPRRADGTLRTYRSHHLGPHPLDEPGETDITADVNFTAMVDAAESAGARVSLHRQDDFLSELGLRERLSEIRQAELEATRREETIERLQLRTLKTEVETLLHPRGLGDFRVLVAVK